jgi:hypothetical protein
VTVVVTLSARLIHITVSDRLVTRSGAAVDILANKLILARLDDALVSVGYTGIASIGGKPTDEWLARQIVPDLDPSITALSFGLGRIPKTLNQFVGNLLAGLANGIVSYPPLRSNLLQFAVSGVRAHRGIVRPYILNVVKGADSEIIHTRLRHRQVPRNPNLWSTWVSGGYWATRPEIFAPMETSLRDLPGDLDQFAEGAKNLMVTAVRALAQTERTVGDELMTTVTFPMRGATLVEFLPLRQHEVSDDFQGEAFTHQVSYTPWIIGGCTVAPPIRLIGSYPLEIDGHIYQLKGGVSDPRLQVFYMGTQRRPRL